MSCAGFSRGGHRHWRGLHSRHSVCQVEGAAARKGLSHAPVQSFTNPGRPGQPARRRTHGVPEARQLLAALHTRSWPTAQQVLAAAKNADELSRLLSVGSNVAGLETWLPDVLRSDLDASLPSLLYGSRMIVWAWEARTGLRAKYVSRDQFELFFARLRIAEDCLQGVVRREPTNAAAWHHLLITARGLQLGVPEARRRFDQAVAHHPGHVQAHQQMLQMVCAKWYGSHEQMHDFARSAMDTASPGSPLGHLAALAYLEEALDKAKYLTDIGGHLGRRRVRAALHEAADRSVRHPDYRRGPDWATVHSAFAMAFALAGEHRAAAEQFRILGDVVMEFPWIYLGDPGAAFCQQRNYVYARS